MKIIKEGKLPTLSATCPHCRTELEARLNELTFFNTKTEALIYFTNCPICTHQVYFSQAR